MKLLIISHTPHYKKGGKIVGWGPTIREINQLPKLFSSITHMAPLHSEEAPDTSLAYDSERIQFYPVDPAGGDCWTQKIGILFKVPSYIKAILSQMPQYDMVHVRCPSNISLVAVILIAFLKRPLCRWFKYAGNWKPEGSEPLSYSFQRWWLNQSFHKSAVTVNGVWKDQPPHVFSFVNPCLTETEMKASAQFAKTKKITVPLKLLYVGRLEAEKGAGRCLDILKGLRNKNITASLDLVGDGPERRHFEKYAESLNVAGIVKFHGWLPRPGIAGLYEQAHFLLHPSVTSEGWPKVLSEAMAYGAVPLAGAISSIPQILERTRAGAALPPLETQSFIEAVEHYVQQPNDWEKTVQAGIDAAPEFTYDFYLKAIAEMTKKMYGVNLQAVSA
jgi:glycosyltransferase involved in cell wall biosynthesis